MSRRKIKQVPKFDSEDQERDFWSDHDSTEFVDWSKARRYEFENLKPSSRTGSAQLPIDLFKRVVETAVRPKCRIIELAVFQDHPQSGLVNEPFEDIGSVHLRSWIRVYYGLEEISTGRRAAGSVSMYLDEDVCATQVLGLDLIGPLFERDIVGAIVDSLLAAVEYYQITRA